MTWNQSENWLNNLNTSELCALWGMSLEEKFLLGAELFDYACRITMDGIRSRFPDADETRVREILEERLLLQRQLEELE